MRQVMSFEALSHAHPWMTDQPTPVPDGILSFFKG